MPFTVAERRTGAVSSTAFGFRGSTVLDTAADTFRPSSVHTAPAASQDVVTGSVMVTSRFDQGWIWIRHRGLRLPPNCHARMTSPLTTVSACCRIASSVVVTRQLKWRFTVNPSEPLCSAAPPKLAVSGRLAGPLIVFMTPADSMRPSGAHTAPGSSQDSVAAIEMVMF